tara:strand:- start:185 stop:397 length:213 start_codon:yes stop_codon:yes gene_type:complete
VERSKYLAKRKKKEVGVCYACGTRKVNAYFYDWYKHPAIALLFEEKDRYNGKICLKCAKREAGNKHHNIL